MVLALSEGTTPSLLMRVSYLSSCGVPFSLFERVFAVNVVFLSMSAKSLSKITECQAEVVRAFLLL